MNCQKYRNRKHEVTLYCNMLTTAFPFFKFRAMVNEHDPHCIIMEEGPFEVEHNLMPFVHHKHGRTTAEHFMHARILIFFKEHDIERNRLYLSRGVDYKVCENTQWEKEFALYLLASQ